MKNGATLHLTLDVERDYGRADTYRALDAAGPLFAWTEKTGLPLTAFVAGEILERGHPIVETLLKAGIPIALHGHAHAAAAFGTMRTSHADEIERAVQAYASRIGKRPHGYRAPAGIISRTDLMLLDQLGFAYDASIFPMRRPHRYDFSRLPRAPFRWEGTRLAEVPFGLMTSSLPAGLTFINLLGPAASAALIGRAARKLAGQSPSGSAPSGYVIDLHGHNLFAYPPALRALPVALRLVYRAGRWSGGLACLMSLADKLRRRGFTFGNLEADALRLDPEKLPAVGFDCFERRARA